MRAGPGARQRARHSPAGAVGALARGRDRPAALLAVGAYFGARDTSVFAVRTLDVRGGDAGAPRRRCATRSPASSGRASCACDGGVVAAAVDPIPGVRSFTVDRAFPHTLRVVGASARCRCSSSARCPGREAFLVAASGRVLRTLAHSASLAPAAALGDEGTSHVQVGGALPAQLRGGRGGARAAAGRRAAGWRLVGPRGEGRADARARRRARGAPRRRRRPAPEARDRAPDPARRPVPRPAAPGTSTSASRSVPCSSTEPQVGG